MTIVLIGMPGSGKTTLGKLYAENNNINFIDTDRLIEQRTGKKLVELLDDNFMDHETNAILSIPLSYNGIISTGGSVVYSDVAMNHLKKIGKIIYLMVEYDDLLKRIDNFETRGILIKPGMTFLDLYNERSKLYIKWCDHWFNNNDLELSLQSIDNIGKYEIHNI